MHKICVGKYCYTHVYVYSFNAIIFAQWYSSSPVAIKLVAIHFGQTYRLVRSFRSVSVKPLTMVRASLSTYIKMC